MSRELLIPLSDFHIVPMGVSLRSMTSTILFMFALGGHFVGLWALSACLYGRVYDMNESGRTLHFCTPIAAIT